MTAEEYRAAQKMVGYTARDIARLLGVHYTTPQRWMNDEMEVPPAIAAWLSRLATAVERVRLLNPPPTGDWSRW